MAVPDYETLMLPLLVFTGDEQVHDFGAAVDALAKQFHVSESELRQMLPSGRYPLFRSRVGWAKTYLTKARLVELPVRGSLRITKRGLDVLQNKPSKIDNEYLRRYPEFLDFQGRKKSDDAPSERVNKPEKVQTPTELLELAHEQIRKTLSQELLEQVQRSSSQFFERLVVDLLVAMGYGGNLRNPGEVTPPSRDGGIDGIINEDILGLSKIYLQAKKWNSDSSVKSPDMQKFVGALTKRHASKGVFITTSRFSEGAKDFVKGLPATVILIDGVQLVELMTKFNVRVAVKETYEIKRIDSDYFSEE